MTTIESLLSGGVGAAFLALALLVAIAALLAVALPAPLRPRLRAPLIFGVLFVVARYVELYVAPGGGWRTFARSLAMLFMLLAFGRLLSLAVVEWLLVQGLKRQPPKILRDIFEGVLLIAAVLLTLRAAGMDPTSLLTTSAVLTAIIGLSMQDTLGNLFAGLSLQAERPFEVGDWIQYDPASRHTGRVVEISWRATKLRTQDLIDVVIPNGQLARSPIINFSRPSALARRSVYVTVPHEVPTHLVHSAIMEAIRTVEGVVPEPLPTVVTHAFHPHGVEHWLRFFITEFEHRDGIDGRVRDRVWYALSRVGIPLASSAHRVKLTHDTEEVQQRAADNALGARLTALRGVELFRDLPEPALATLGRAGRSVLYEGGEVVVQQGARDDELFLCVRGSLVVQHTPSGGTQSREIARLTPGGVFGELSLMTGAPRTATVITSEPCELLVIGKAAVASVLASEPALAERLSARLAERQAALEALAIVEPIAKTTTMEERTGQLLSRIRDFFSL
jgi:small-conductance mechanosensitive channel/CRP-like cAMP-binding protein